MAITFLTACQGPRVTNQIMWQSAAYTVYPDKIVQGEFTAQALSRTEITSDYQSPANEFQSPEIAFKFSINSKDNEMPPGQDHVFVCLDKDGSCETPVIKFGQYYKDTTTIPPNAFLPPNTALTVKLDMSDALTAFEKDGYYTTYQGNKIFKEDFKGVYIAGNSSPLTWDFDNLASREGMELQDPDGDGIYEVMLNMNAHREDKQIASHWKQSVATNSYPQYTSDYLLADALYNMSLEEVVKNIEADSTFRTGKEWAGVWTRDISYSVILALATLEPQLSKNSLMRKVKNGRIVQDTGTGGAYPVSTDRIIWAVAAWEVYAVTGDEKWLREIYPIIKNSVEDDLINAYNPRTGMMRGESSFLDWREQTYPKWMQPADIYESENLGTNAAHYQAHVLLAKMAELLQEIDAAAKYKQTAETIKAGINEHLWLAEKGYYGQYLYGRNYQLLSPRSEALGEALSVIYNVADATKVRSVVARTPVYKYGIPSIYPQIPNIPPYHNNGIWPFVQAYWSLAAAKAGNEHALTESINALYRPAALFLTNKENFVASNGDYAGTQINSDRQLWSVAGNIAITYKIFFGMDFQADKLILKPFVPELYKGRRTLTNFKYRNSILNIEMNGFGNEIKSITMDGQPLPDATIPGNLTGNHTIVIDLAGKAAEKEIIAKVSHHVAPATPSVTLLNSTILSWQPVEGAKNYKVLKNGTLVETTSNPKLAVAPDGYAEYQVIAVDATDHESFASEPVAVSKSLYTQLYEAEAFAAPAPYPYKGFSGKGFVELTKQKNTFVTFNVTVPEPGVYAIDFRYSNGNGPVNTDNKAAIRNLKKDNTFLGTIVLPQRGVNEWSEWGFTNTVQVHLEKGTHNLTLTFDKANENMNFEINQAMIDYMRVTKLN